MRKISPLPEFDPRIVQPVVSRPGLQGMSSLLHAQTAIVNGNNGCTAGGVESYLVRLGLFSRHAITDVHF